MIPWTDYDLGWLAGFYEGEGSVCIHPHGGIHLKLYQNDPEPLERARRLAGGNIYTGKTSAGNQRHILVVAGHAAVEAMVTLSPHLSRRRQAQIGRVLERVAARPGKGRRGTRHSPGQMRLEIAN